MPTPKRCACRPQRRADSRWRAALRPATPRRRRPMIRRPLRRTAAAGLMASSRAWLAALLVAAGLGAPARAEEPKVFQFTLQNGLSVLVIPDHRAPIVTQILFYRVGATDDPPGNSGLAHFFEHMMFRGTPSVPGDQFARIVARNGGEDNAFTTEDYTAFYEQIAKDRLPLIMGLDADRMTNLDLSDG